MKNLLLVCLSLLVATGLLAQAPAANSSAPPTSPAATPREKPAEPTAEDKDIAQCLKNLGDESAVVRVANAEALAAYGPRVREAVLKAWKEGKGEARWAALQVLGKVGQAEDGKELLPLLVETDEIKLFKVLEALSHLMYPGARDRILPLLGHPSPLLRAQAAAYLGATGEKGQDEDKLLPLLEDRFPFVVTSAIVALGQVGTGTTLAALEKKLLATDDSGQAGQIIEALASLKAGDRLLSYGAKCPATLRGKWLQALGRSQAPGAVAVLREEISQGSRGLPWLALAGLGEMGTPEALAGLREVLSGKDDGLAAEAARFLGKQRDAKAVEGLLARCKNGNPALRLECIQALGAIGDASATDTLMVALKDTDKRVIAAAAEALESHAWKLVAEIRKARADWFLPRLNLEFEGKGSVTMELYEDEFPNTVANFVRLADEEFFSNQKLYKVEPGVALWTGDPDGLSTGGPGYTIRKEKGPQPLEPGAILMDPEGTAWSGSRFLILLGKDAFNQDNRESRSGEAFGKVVAGLDLLAKLTPEDRLLSVKVEKKREHEYLPETSETVTSEDPATDGDGKADAKK